MTQLTDEGLQKALDYLRKRKGRPARIQTLEKHAGVIGDWRAEHALRDALRTHPSVGSVHTRHGDYRWISEEERAASQAHHRALAARRKLWQRVFAHSEKIVDSDAPDAPRGIYYDVYRWKGVVFKDDSPGRTVVLRTDHVQLTCGIADLLPFVENNLSPRDLLDQYAAEFGGLNAFRLPAPEENT